MSLFIVIRKPIKEGFLTAKNTKNPSENELLQDLKSYPQVYVLHSLADAEKVAELFFHAPKQPKVNGGYGLIAKVSVEFKDEPGVIKVDAATIYNNWIDSQKVGYEKKENSRINYDCTIVSPAQIKSLCHTFISEKTKACNSNLQNTNFIRASSQCLIM